MTLSRYDTSVRPADRLMAEAVALIDAGRRRGVQLRLTGGLAVRRYCSDLDFMDRQFSDIDLIGVSRQSRELHRLFGERGYDENRYVSQSTGGAQLQFVTRGRLLESRAHFQKRPRPVARIEAAPLVDHIDVFLDLMSMDHDVDVRGRLDIDEYAIAPVDVLITKLQIGHIAAKDVHDVIALLKDLELSERSDDRAIDLPHLARVCARDWGLCNDLRGNLDVVRARLDGEVLSDEDRACVEGRLRAIGEAIAREPKSLRWRLRARVGTRLPWRREVEEREGSPVIATVTVVGPGAAWLSCADCGHAADVPAELLARGAAPLACPRCGGLAWAPLGLEQDEEQPAA